MILGKTNIINFTHNHCVSHAHPRAASTAKEPQTHTWRLLSLSLPAVGWGAGWTTERSLGASQPLNKGDNWARQGSTLLSQILAETRGHPWLCLEMRGSPPTTCHPPPATELPVALGSSSPGAADGLNLSNSIFNLNLFYYEHFHKCK